MNEPAPTIAGYSYLRPLGSGGFADVYLYQQDTPRRKVAIKVLRRDVINDKVLKMFKLESDAMAELSGHPNIIQVYETSVTLDGRPYIAMEYCEKVLSDMLKTKQFTIGEVLEIGVHLCDALYAAHNEGILHRDIKPSNLMFNRHGVLVLSDFGIAGKLVGEQTTALSYKWAAPEVVKHETTGTIHSEVYSFGITLWTLLIGHNPFDNAPGEKSLTTNSIKSLVKRGKINFHTDRADIPAEMFGIIRKATNSDPEVRFNSMREVGMALQEVQAALGLSKTPIITEPEPNSMSSNVDTLGERLEHADISAIQTERYLAPNTSGNNREYKSRTRSSVILQEEQLKQTKARLNKVYVGIAFLVILVVILLAVLLL